MGNAANWTRHLRYSDRDFAAMVDELTVNHYEKSHDFGTTGGKQDVYLITHTHMNTSRALYIKFCLRPDRCVIASFHPEGCKNIYDYHD